MARSRRAAHAGSRGRNGGAGVRHQFVGAYEKRYWPEPTSTTAASPSCRLPVIPLPSARGLPDSVTAASVAFGSRTVARVFGGTSTTSSNRPLSSVQAEPTLPYGESWLAFTLVKPPPGRGWTRRCLYAGAASSISRPAITRYIQSPIAPYA